jgi:pilus assembly protein Flp/PilA
LTGDLSERIVAKQEMRRHRPLRLLGLDIDSARAGRHPIRGFGDFEMLSIFRRLAKNEKGATAIEYTLIASLIAVAAIASMRTVGGKVTNVLTNVSNSMT